MENTPLPPTYGGPGVMLFYQFLYPDNVVSAAIWTDLSLGLQSCNWTLTAHPSNRSCHGITKYPRKGSNQGVSIRRIWRPNFPQASAIGRILNAAWMITAWSLLPLTTKPAVVLIGTDPILSVLTAPIWRLLSPKTRIVHWCFDLYPEAAVADGLLTPNSPLVRILSALARRAYRSCDLIADLGPCMRQSLAAYNHQAQSVTLTPWALQEPNQPVPQDPQERQTLFPPATQLGLLYSGSFGRAHVFEPFLALARAAAARHLPIHLTFSVRGNREAALRAAIRPESDSNITLAGFAPPDRLEARLSAPDIHLVSLHPDWTGTVVPSKFFGALAVGRPVIFAGSPDSAIAQYIHQYKVGWVLASDTDPALILNELETLIADPAKLQALCRHCHQVYTENFSKQIMCDAWDRHLRALLNPEEPKVET